jgi:hypothetical protein
MLRTPAFLVDHSGSSTPLARSIEDDVQPNSIRWGSISSTQPVYSGPEQIRVYHEWIGMLARCSDLEYFLIVCRCREAS